MVNKPESWTGNMVHIVAGNMSSITENDFDFTINIDNSITGIWKYSNSTSVKIRCAEFTYSIPGVGHANYIDITGIFDERNNKVNLETHGGKRKKVMNISVPGIGTMRGVLERLGNPVWFTGFGGKPQVGIMDPAPYQEPGDRTLPPIEKKSGGTVTVSTSALGISVTTVYTIYPALEIIRLDRKDTSFLADQSKLSFEVKINKRGVDPNTANWTVTGKSTDSVNGNPNTANNTSTFCFTPNPTNRPTTGSRVPNDPIKYTIQVTVGGLTETLDLEQDEIDIIRQEYVDFGTTPPTRAKIIKPTNPQFNKGNYNLIVDNGMQHALTNTIQQFQILSATPSIPTVTVSSGYRNPRRNVEAGSLYPIDSRHVWGSALDLEVSIANATTWTNLRQAGQNAGYSSICEKSSKKCKCDGTDKDPTDPTGHNFLIPNHVHIQW